MKKIGIIITSHGKFCLGAVDSLKMIIGGCDDIETVSVTLTSSVQEVEKEMNDIYENDHIYDVLYLYFAQYNAYHFLCM